MAGWLGARPGLRSGNAAEWVREVVAEGADGAPVGVGRAGRTIPSRLWRLVKRRDGGRCRFPGCGRTRWL